MRLTCPNCSAQYEVPDEVIPEEGRDVQCSNCDQTWFQAKHTAPETPEPAPVEAEESEVEVEVAEQTEQAVEEPKAEPEPEPEPEPEEETQAAATGNIDPAVASILQEEAEREAELRSKEGGSLESQPDLALDTPPEPKVEPKHPAATETAEDAGQKDALPDVEVINSSLRSDDIVEPEETEQPAPRKSGGFMRGFALMLIIGVVLYMIYGYAQQISEAVPQADPVLSSYVSLVDQARIWLETQTGSATSQN